MLKRLRTPARRKSIREIMGVTNQFVHVSGENSRSSLPSFETTLLPLGPLGKAFGCGSGSPAAREPRRDRRRRAAARADISMFCEYD